MSSETTIINQFFDNPDVTHELGKVFNAADLRYYFITLYRDECTLFPPGFSYDHFNRVNWEEVAELRRSVKGNTDAMRQ